MPIFFRTKRQRVAWAMLMVFTANLLSPATTYALTSGPTQPELQGFQPAGTSDMVDLFSGDFSYNIPLFELPGPNGGYPFNLSYQSEIGLDQEASWVGLGWSLNPGAINRQMRGLPDDFSGDPITTTMSVEPNFTTGAGFGGSLEIFGGAKEVGNLGLSMFYNNYKGWGYSVDASAGFAKSIRGGMTAGLGVNLSLNSQEGATVSPSLTLGTKIGEFGLTSSYNRLSGASNIALTTDRYISYHGKANASTSAATKTSEGVEARAASALTVVNPGYTPQVSMAMNNLSTSVKINTGGAWWGLFTKAYIKGFYNEQRLKNDNKPISSPAYGYLNYEKGKDDATAILDFNREKDGPVSVETPNLGIPSMTYDIYSVTGQGIGAMYRPIRNDIGILRDPEVVSESTGVAAGADLAPGAAHAGANLSINHSNSTSGGWADKNLIANNIGFQGKVSDDAFEPWNFKVHGELTAENVTVLDAVGGNNPVRVQVTDKSDPIANSVLLNPAKGISRTVNGNTSRDRSRKQRNEVIQTFTNEQIMNPAAGTGNEILSFFKNTYVKSGPGGSEVTFERNELLVDANKKKHIGGFSALTSDGLRYNYTIPVYNNKQEEYIFSVTGTTTKGKVSTGKTEDDAPTPASGAANDQFYKKTELPPYAHSYLLTSIVGADYVDVDNNGVSVNDLGYWVKFTYTKTTSANQYKWRDPINNAHYLKGWQNNSRDDKGTYTYGEKDLWYLTKAETKSHLAIFTLGTRDDAKGVFKRNRDDNTATLGQESYRLTDVKLYSRVGFSQNYPIKTVKFSHDYSLCSQTPNSSASTKGKLTLNSIEFIYGTANRPTVSNPFMYTFTYDAAKNFTYASGGYDRWGNYKPRTGNTEDDYANSLEFPYVDQYPANKVLTTDNYASAWSLTQIKTPSGSTILVDYESDDYGYVQHMPAMQMMPMFGTGGSTSDITLNNTPTIRFKLDQPVSESSLPGVSDKPNLVKSYLDMSRKQVFFKVLINLLSDGSKRDYISGYAQIDDSNESNFTLEPETAGTNDTYVYGVFKLTPETYKSGATTVNVHPFTKAVWQHLRTTQPELLNPDIETKYKESDGLVDRLSAIVSKKLWTDLKNLFTNFYVYCSSQHFGEQIDATKSLIRLNSVDKIKYGGGSRVSQVTVKDNWQGDDEGVYGQVYDYTIEEDGKTISSGVAAYEPLIGGEENAVRYAKPFSQKVTVRTDNSLFFEYPINESYYPGPQVGYRKVTVMSLAAASLAGRPIKNGVTPTGNLFPTGTDPVTGKFSYGTTGKTIHEFYTAKDFPVITDETDKIDLPFNLPIPVPFLGHVMIQKLASTQGYSIITNDMHGKVKQVSTCRQASDGTWEKDPISYVKYNYLSDKRVYQQQNVFELRNDFRINADNATISTPNAGNTNNAKYTMGQENEFFLDMRQHEDNAWEGGANVNLDLVFIPILGIVTIPVPTIWPSLGKSQNQLRTVVSNKIIFRPGILESVEAYDGGSLVRTDNKKWDPLTGQVVLSTVNNNFNNLVYSYTIPAYTKYTGLGGAYKNIGLKLTVRSVIDAPKAGEYYFSSNLNTQMLFPGDEILLFNDDAMTDVLTKVIYMGDIGVMKKISSPVDLTDNNPLTLPKTFTGLIIRSGYRNQLNASAGTITALQDPSIPGQQVTRSKLIFPTATP